MAGRQHVPPTPSAPVAAYLVLSHRDPAQVERLTAAIRASSPRSHVFVLHDARRSEPPASEDPRVHVRAHGAPTDWASWDLVEQTLAGLRWVREAADPDLVVLISGQCYPLRPLAAWEEDFVSRGGGWQGTARALSYTPRWGRRRGEGDDDLTRYTYRWIRVPRTGLAVPTALDRLRTRVRAAVALRLEPVFSVRKVGRGGGLYYGFRRVSTPFGPGRACFKGWQWLAMDSGLLAHVTDELRAGKPLYEFYRHSLVADESLIQTALSWVEPPRQSTPVSFCEWDAARDATTTWTPADLGRLLASGSPFARKVDPVRSRDLMDALDAVIAPTGVPAATSADPAGDERPTG